MGGSEFPVLLLTFRINLRREILTSAHLTHAGTNQSKLHHNLFYSFLMTELKIKPKEHF